MKDIIDIYYNENKVKLHTLFQSIEKTLPS